MKKTLIALLVLVNIVACKKDQEVTDAEGNVADSAIAISENTDNVIDKPILEYNTQQVSELLNTKNDTLYVTNFFATWCGPCMREMPHFTAKMGELKNQPVKFTFVSLDEKKDWNTKVTQFGNKFKISENIILLDGMTLTPEFFTENFDIWDGSSIPFTMMRKGDKKDEFVGMMTENQINEKISEFLGTAQ